MQIKIITLLATFVLLFSFRGLSQTVDTTTEKSAHPLLDKYYPQAQPADTNKTVSTQIKPGSDTKPAQALKTIPVKTNTPTFTAVPVDTTLATGTQSVSAMPATTTTSVVTSTTTVAKPTTVTAQAPPQKVQGPPPPPPYMDTRLGSSTKQYDTWEKNNNGAGSVTTSPK